jgi:[ribosomal protein S5]-alanine N-acetyltransferase
MNCPTLQTERLTLREFAASDDEFLFRHFADPDVCRYLYDAEPFTCVEEARRLIEFFAPTENKDRNRWGVCLQESGELIGTCGFMFWDRANRIAELGYDLAHAHWGHGYMPEAVRAALGFAFDELELNRVHAYTSVDNAQSVRLLEKLGFAKEGVVREKHLFRGRYYDHYCFSLLAREWAAQSR